MRKFLIPIVAAASTLAIAAPAAAQWAPPVYNYQPYNYGRGWNFHQYARSMEQRVQRIRPQRPAVVRTIYRIFGSGDGDHADVRPCPAGVIAAQ